MKITDVKLRFAKHYLFVQVYTDAGIVGLGEAGNWGYLQATAAAIEITVAKVRANANIGFPDILDNSCRISFLFNRHHPPIGRTEQQRSTRP